MARVGGAGNGKLPSLQFLSVHPPSKHVERDPLYFIPKSPPLRFDEQADTLVCETIDSLWKTNIENTITRLRKQKTFLGVSNLKFDDVPHAEKFDNEWTMAQIKMKQHELSKMSNELTQIDECLQYDGNPDDPEEKCDTDLGQKRWPLHHAILGQQRVLDHLKRMLAMNDELELMACAVGCAREIVYLKLLQHGGMYDRERLYFMTWAAFAVAWKTIGGYDITQAYDGETIASLMSADLKFARWYRTLGATGSKDLLRQMEIDMLKSVDWIACAGIQRECGEQPHSTPVGKDVRAYKWVLEKLRGELGLARARG